MRQEIDGYNIDNIKIVAAFDVDKRKVNKTLKEAILAKPNCTPLFISPSELPEGPKVSMGYILDGVSSLMLEQPEDKSFRISTEVESNIIDILINNKVDILINFLPVGSQTATEFYASCCIKTKISLLNCIPVFIASDPIRHDSNIVLKCTITITLHDLSNMPVVSHRFTFREK